MYLTMSKEEILDLVKINVVVEIALWDMTKKAVEHYSSMDNLYTSMNDDDVCLATPVKVFMFLRHDFVFRKDNKITFLMNKD